MPNIKYLFYYDLVLDDVESAIAEYQQYNVLNSSSKKRRNLTHCQDPVIYTAVYHQDTSDIYPHSMTGLIIIIPFI